MMKISKFFLLIVTVFFISGCASARHAVPEDLLSQARVFGMQDIRAFGGIPSDILKEDFLNLLEREKKIKSLADFMRPRTYAMLAISGGAANGAYGAGLLSGWSISETRPAFQTVTGISTGAIIAPFAFLGSKYDNLLEEFYTKYSTRDVMQLRFPFVNSLVSTRPLERIIERYYSAEVLKEIALEYQKGRRLYVGTTNLDAQRLVIWDMGKIASFGNEKSLRLFRKVILASASIPVAFPPVYFNVQAGGKDYDEMHVDGGITRQVFFIYDVLQGLEKAVKEKGLDPKRNKYRIYVIRNGYVDPHYKEVPDKIISIAERTMDTMTNAQSIGDIYQLYVFAKNGNKGDFNLAYIPASYISCAKESFDPVDMKKLYELGFNDAVEGYAWRKSPPGVE